MKLKELQQSAAMCGRPIHHDQAEQLRDRLEKEHPGVEPGDLPLQHFVSALLTVRGEHRLDGTPPE